MHIKPSKQYFLLLLGVLGLVAYACGSVEVANLNPDEFSGVGDTTDQCADRNANFSANVVPIFTATGCTNLGCHGQGDASGSLSFEGTTETVFGAVTSGGRINTTTPGSSKLLRKAVGLDNHGGGAVLDGVDDSNYLTMLCWITAGAQNN